MAKKHTLTEKHRAFIEAYIANPNAGEAARESGHAGTENALRVAGCKMLKHPLVSVELERRRAVVQQKSDVTIVSILTRLNDLANRCMQARPVMAHDREAGGMVQKMTTDANGEPVGLYEFDSAGANRALELLGKHLGMFTERVKVEGDVQHYVVALPSRIESKADWMKSVKSANVERIT